MYFKSFLLLIIKKGVSSFAGADAFCYMMISSIAYFVILAISLSDFNPCFVLEDEASVSVDTKLINIGRAGVVNAEAEAEVASLSSYT